MTATLDSCPSPSRPRFLLPAVLLSLVASPLGCTDSGEYEVDAGHTQVSGLKYEDIGTLCTCKLVFNATTGGYACNTNPTNSCAKSGMTCLIASPDANANNAGNGLWEGPIFSVGRMGEDNNVVVEGECTVVGTPLSPPPCPQGTLGITLSSGITVCKRQCQADQECGRADWVCDTPFLDRRGVDMDPVAELPLALKVCRPRCVADFPDCNRSTPCNLGRPGCYRSALTRNAPGDLGIYVGDRNGSRVCNTASGHCEAVATRNNLAQVGSPCSTHADCGTNYLCVSAAAYGAPDGLGFCTYANCNPDVAPAESGCVPGLTCERAFEMGMCFPDCAGGTICGGSGVMCGQPVPDYVYNFDPLTGTPLGWKQNQCVDCALAGQCP